MMIPRRELVGRNARLEEGIYRDDYLTELNKVMPVDEVFSGCREEIAHGGNIVGRLVMETLRKIEWENHLVSIVMTAALSREWRAVFREPLIHDKGLDAVTKKHYGYVVEHEGKRFLVPSPLYVTYCKDVLEKHSNS